MEAAAGGDDYTGKTAPLHFLTPNSKTRKQAANLAGNQLARAREECGDCEGKNYCAKHAKKHGWVAGKKRGSGGFNLNAAGLAHNAAARANQTRPPGP